MSASLTSGGAAPSSVTLLPQIQSSTLNNTGLAQGGYGTANGVGSLVLQQGASAQQPVINPGAGQTTALGSSVANTILAIIQPPFATNFSTGAPVAEGQSQFVFSCPNATAAGGGAPGGALTLYSYINGNINNALFSAPKPSLIAGTGDDILQLMGGSQAGVAVFSSATANTTVVVPNTLVQVGSPIFLQPQGAANATATSFTVSAITGTSFTITANAAATVADKSVSWFIPRY